MAVNRQTSAKLDGEPAVFSASTVYAWSVFGLTFLLMMSDFISRQVIVAIFPFLKVEWALSDAQLGSLVSIVALTVGLLTFPISLLVDRWGRVKGIALMAVLWSLATIACGFAGTYSQMLTARAVVGLGEAGYGSAGSAILSHVFPPQRRSAVMGAFLAAGLFGSVLGVVLGGVLATHLTWQAAFIVVGVPGLLLALLYPLFVRDYQTVALVVAAGQEGSAARKMRVVEGLKELFGAPSVVFTYVGSGLQMLVQSSIISWLPSYLNRYYGLAPERAAIKAAGVVLIGGVGMVCGGYLADRLSRKNYRRKLSLPALYAFGSFILLTTAFSLSAGSTQFFLIMFGGFLASAHAGVTVAVVADVIHPGLRTTALATLALAMNLIGLAPGPFIVGAMSDAFGLSAAMAIIPLAGVGAAICFQLGSRHLAGGAPVRPELAEPPQ